MRHFCRILRSADRALPVPSGYREDAVAFLARCRAPGGGFGGGPGQQAHLATTYAACAALCTLGGADAVAALDRPSLLRFLLRLKLPAEQARAPARGACRTPLSSLLSRAGRRLLHDRGRRG